MSSANVPKLPPPRAKLESGTRMRPPPLPPSVAVATRPRAMPPPLPPSAFVAPVIAPPVIAPAALFVQPPLLQARAAQRTLTEELPDFMNGAVRQRRMRIFLAAIAFLAVAGTAIAAITSHY